MLAVVVSEVVNVPELEVPEIIAVVPYSSVLTPLVVDLLSMSVVVIDVLISGVVSLPVTTMYHSQFHNISSATDTFRMSPSALNLPLQSI